MAAAFGTLLKSWRAQRRMSQFELGLTANVSARHISFLETGRSKPSQAMVLQLSESLAIPPANRNALLGAAGFANAYSARDLAADEMRFVREAMDWTLERHHPYPALALDRHWNLIRHNGVAGALLAPLGLGVGDSMLEALAKPTPFAAALENRDEIARHLVVRLRTECRFYGGDPLLEQAAEMLEATLPPDRLTSDNAIPAVFTAQYAVNGQRFTFFSTIAQFGSTQDIALADIKIELMFPADEGTRERLHQQFG